MRLGCVLLASGYARRYGSNKLLTLRDGLPLYRRAFAALPPALFAKAVVTSQYEEILTAAGREGYLPLFNPRPWEGISAGLRLGLSALTEMDGTMFAVCDQPNLTTESIIRLIDYFLESPASICALSWAGRRGNPVIFPRTLYPELLSLSGDKGGSAVIKRHLELLRLVEASSAGELRDVDTPED